MLIDVLALVGILLSRNRSSSAPCGSLRTLAPKGAANLRRPSGSVVEFQVRSLAFVGAMKVLYVEFDMNFLVPICRCCLLALLILRVGSALLESVDADNDCEFVCARDDCLESARRDRVV